MTPATLLTLRRLCGMTQQECADYLGVAKRTLECWEGGQRTVSLAAVERLRNLVAQIRTHAATAAEHADHVRYRTDQAYWAAGNDALPLPAYHAVVERAIAERECASLPWSVRWAE